MISGIDTSQTQRNLIVYEIQKHHLKVRGYTGLDVRQATWSVYEHNKINPRLSHYWTLWIVIIPAGRLPWRFIWSWKGVPFNICDSNLSIEMAGCSNTLVSHQGTITLPIYRCNKESDITLFIANENDVCFVITRKHGRTYNWRLKEK